jgi:hypothetical protein
VKVFISFKWYFITIKMLSFFEALYLLSCSLLSLTPE